MEMPSTDLTELIERRLPETAIGASALRNQGAKGVVAAAREYLRTMELAKCCNQRTFRQQLDEETSEMLASFPEGCDSWGAARKALNLFLRDALYNRYTSAAYNLDAVESVMEVPLDDQVASRLIKEPEGRRLARWPRLIRLTPSVSSNFQAVAKAVAERHSLSRVHLDLMYWRDSAG